ncbi:MAG: DUF1232 domain-containing protein [Ignavibacteriae bacterium]|nr:DUF1232 domain-containing protein [Ignavibacteriota bacterium]
MRDVMRMIAAWLNGTYRVFPWLTLMVLILVGIYAINPFDIIPDFIPIVGVIDDAAMLGFLVRSLMRDVRKFREWERTQTTRQPAVPTSSSPPSTPSETIDAKFEEIRNETRPDANSKP